MSDSPRVLMVSDVYFPRVNGVSTSIQTFRRDLADLGCQTLLIAPAYPMPWNDEPGTYRVRSRYLPFDPEDRVMIRRHFRHVAASLSDPVDIVHIHTPFLAHYCGVSLARRLGAKLVVSYHTYFEHYFHHYLPVIPKQMLKALARSISRAQLDGVDRVIAPTEPMAVTLKDYGVTRPIDVVPTGLDLDRFAAGNGDRFRHAHGIERDRPVILTVSRVAYEKNLAFLIDVLEEVRRQVPRVLFVVAGEGPALSSLKNDVRRRGLTDNVRFVGYLDRASGLLDCYRAADVFVFASRTETQGLVLLESMAVGTPVVSTAVMGTASVLADARGAVVVDESVPEFSRAVADLLGDSGRRRQLADQAVEHVARHWSGREMARRVLQIYRAVAAE